MAELRQAEQELSEIRAIYRQLRSHGSLKSILPELSSVSEDDNEKSEIVGESDDQSYADLVENLNNVKNRTAEMEERVQKFRKRAEEKDPVTGNPRYGAKTLARVHLLLNQHLELATLLETYLNDSKLSIVHEKANQETKEAARRDQEDQDRVLELKRQAEEQEKERQRALQQAQEAERQRQQEEREYAQRLARQAIEADQLARQQAEAADREWERNIPRGSDGVRVCLKRLVDATARDPTAKNIAINALHTIFTQIVARPEEDAFRRIRRDHPKFQQDVGRHDGGREILIAAGFRLGTIDDVPSYISTEPNLEKDMDGWSEWFDLKKETLAIIEEQRMK